MSRRFRPFGLGPVAITLGAAFLLGPSPAPAIADGGTTFVFSAAQKRRAQILFRNYCMDCHGPKLTGRDNDPTLRCPNVQGKSPGDYREKVLSGADIMPAFRLGTRSDGNLLLSPDDLNLLTNHEATFASPSD